MVRGKSANLPHITQTNFYHSQEKKATPRRRCNDKKMREKS
jgi:hypothetical protein